jgi:hypothetical protein
MREESVIEASMDVDNDTATSALLAFEARVALLHDFKRIGCISHQI